MEIKMSPILQLKEVAQQSQLPKMVKFTCTKTQTELVVVQ